MHSAKTSGFLKSFKEDGSVPENSLLATSDVVEIFLYWFPLIINRISWAVAS